MQKNSCSLPHKAGLILKIIGCCFIAAFFELQSRPMPIFGGFLLLPFFLGDQSQIAVIRSQSQTAMQHFLYMHGIFKATFRFIPFAAAQIKQSQSGSRVSVFRFFIFRFKESQGLGQRFFHLLAGIVQP